MVFVIEDDLYLKYYFIKNIFYFQSKFRSTYRRFFLAKSFFYTKIILFPATS